MQSVANQRKPVGRHPPVLEVRLAGRGLPVTNPTPLAAGVPAARVLAHPGPEPPSVVPGGLHLPCFRGGCPQSPVGERYRWARPPGCGCSTSDCPLAKRFGQAPGLRRGNLRCARVEDPRGPGGVNRRGDCQELRRSPARRVAVHQMLHGARLGGCSDGDHPTRVFPGWEVVKRTGASDSALPLRVTDRSKWPGGHRWSSKSRSSVSRYGSSSNPA